MVARAEISASSTPPSANPTTVAALATAPNMANTRPRRAAGARRPSSTAAATFRPPLPRPPSTFTGASQPTAGTAAIRATPRQVTASEPRRSTARPGSEGRRRATHQPPATEALIHRLPISPYTVAVECSVDRMKNTSATLTRLAAATTAPTRVTAARTSGSCRTVHPSGPASLRHPCCSSDLVVTFTSPGAGAAERGAAPRRGAAARRGTTAGRGAAARRGAAPRRVRIRRPAAAMAR